MESDRTAGLADSHSLSFVEDYDRCVTFLNMLELSFHSENVGGFRLIVCDELGLIASFDEETGDLINFGLQ